MTGLTNRRGFNVLADQLINMTNRLELNVILFFIDLDRLKWINDNLGHAAGDQALRDTALILKNTFRSSDIIARFGGDEFVILAIESLENSRKNMLARLQENLNKFNAQPGRGYQLACSTGLARYEWQHPRSIEALIEEADQTMYIIKQAKKSQIP